MSQRPMLNIAEPGIKAPPQLARTLREEVSRLLARNSLAFPGAQPVSFSRKHIEELRRNEYVFAPWSPLAHPVSK